MTSTKTNKITEFQKITLLKLKIQMQNSVLLIFNSFFFPLQKCSSKEYKIKLFPIKKSGNFATFLNNHL